MQRPDKTMHIHLVGICGTGMASLAAMLKDAGYAVSGSDEGIYPPMSDFLAQKAISVSQGYNLSNLQPEPDLVVIGNALSRGNPEIEYVLNFGVPYTSFPEALKEFFLRQKTSVVVTGTHGKTTTTSILAWVLHAAGLDPSFFIGGIAENFKSSYALAEGAHFVVEGDEYDSAFFDKGPKFLHYLPRVAIIGNVEFDHADIYPDLDAIQLQFRRFVNLIPERGYLAVGAESAHAVEVSAKSLCRKETFGIAGPFDWTAHHIGVDGARGTFDIMYRENCSAGSAWHFTDGSTYATPWLLPRSCIRSGWRRTTSRTGWSLLQESDADCSSGRRQPGSGSTRTSRITRPRCAKR